MITSLCQTCPRVASCSLTTPPRCVCAPHKQNSSGVSDCSSHLQIRPVVTAQPASLRVIRFLLRYTGLIITESSPPRSVDYMHFRVPKLYDPRRRTSAGTPALTVTTEDLATRLRRMASPKHADDEEEEEESGAPAEDASGGLTAAQREWTPHNVHPAVGFEFGTQVRTACLPKAFAARLLTVTHACRMTMRSTGTTRL